MKGLTSLPYEVLANVISSLDFDDVIRLGRSCCFFQYLHTEESISKSIVQSKIQFSYEAKSAVSADSGNAAALRRAAKRRDALATANPFVMAIVGLGDAFIYSNGILCYTLDDRVRVLDLHNSSQHETVISIPKLLANALSKIEDCNRGVFQVLYYADNIISCLYKTSGSEPTAWLISFNLRIRFVLVTRELSSVDKIFVRHNADYIYYGTHSEIGTDGYKKWVIHGFDIEGSKWFPEKIRLPDMVGSEIGSTVCFEFYRGDFYALSNQTSFEVEEIDWTSFYHCVRFPLNSPMNDLVEKTVDNNMWRRQHQEGPIDDRWTSLRLDQDETTGELKVVESRKEWYLGSSRSQITYYKTDLIFPKVFKNDEELAFEYSQTGSADISTISTNNSASNLASMSTASSAASSSAASSSAAASTSMAIPTISSGASSPSSPKPYEHDLSLLPDDPLLKLLRADDNPHHMTPPPRLPQNTQPGDDGTQKPTFTLAKSRIRHYHTCANTYLDLVDDPLPSDWQGTQRLRLRSGSRKLGPPLTHKSGINKGLLRPPNEDLQTALGEMYIQQPTTLWPPAQDPENINEDLDAVYRVMNPPSHLGNVHGTADERSIVYATGGDDVPKALVFVGFDPVVKLEGLKTWGRKGVGEGPHVDGRATGCEENAREIEQSMYVDVEEADRMIGMDRKGKEKENRNVEREVKVEFEERKANSHTSWAWIENAMYKDIGVGFHFGLPRKGD